MRPAHLAVLAVGGIVAVLIGLRTCGSTPDTGSRPAGEHRDAATIAITDASPGPGTVVDGVPQGWSHNPAGARGAAISAVRLTGDIARAGFISRTDMIQALATGRYGPALAADSAAQLDEMTGELDDAGVTRGSVVFSELPLTAHVVTADDSRCRVEVWSVLVIAVPGRGAPRQAWRTVTVDLAWEDHDWRIDGWAALPGPTPALATEAPIASVDELVDVAGWPAAAGGG
ncbi:MAG: hypothetical protein ACRD07_09375 [Acidimicrobiales bacterium]